MGWGSDSTALEGTWLELGDIKLGLMGFAYMQLHGCSQYGGFLLSAGDFKSFTAEP